VRADEPGPAGHEKTSHPISLKQLREQYLGTSAATGPLSPDVAGR